MIRIPSLHGVDIQHPAPTPHSISRILSNQTHRVAENHPLINILTKYTPLLVIICCC